MLLVILSYSLLKSQDSTAVRQRAGRPVRVVVREEINRDKTETKLRTSLLHSLGTTEESKELSWLVCRVWVGDKTGIQKKTWDTLTYTSNSQILATSNFSTNNDIVPWIGEKLHIGAKFQQFSRNNMYVRVPGKLSDIQSKVMVFSNPGDNIQLLVELRDRYVFLLLHILGPCLLDWRTLGLWNVFLTVFQAP